MSSTPTQKVKPCCAVSGLFRSLNESISAEVRAVALVILIILGVVAGGWIILTLLSFLGQWVCTNIEVGPSNPKMCDELPAFFGLVMIFVSIIIGGLACCVLFGLVMITYELYCWALRRCR